MQIPVLDGADNTYSESFLLKSFLFAVRITISVVTNQLFLHITDSFNCLCSGASDSLGRHTVICLSKMAYRFINV